MMQRLHSQQMCLIKSRNKNFDNKEKASSGSLFLCSNLTKLAGVLIAYIDQAF
jgi:hypothetical protein